MSTVTTFLNLVKPAPLENFSRATYNNNLDLIDARAVTTEKFAKGIVISKYVAANSGIVSDAIIDNFPSVTFKAGRKYEITWEADWQHDTANNYFGMSINSAATTDAANLLTGLTQLDTSTNLCNNANSAQHFRTTAFFEPTSDTTLQIKFRLQRLVGGGVAQINGNATNKIKYTIKDEGAQY